MPSTRRPWLTWSTVVAIFASSGVAIGVAGHHHTDAQATRLRGERGQHGPAFEAGAVRVAEDGDEVVEDPGAVEAEGLGLLPGGEEVVPGDILIGGLDAEADVRGRLRQRGPGEEERQGDEGGGTHAAPLARSPHAGQSAWALRPPGRCRRSARGRARGLAARTHRSAR